MTTPLARRRTRRALLRQPGPPPPPLPPDDASTLLCKIAFLELLIQARAASDAGDQGAALRLAEDAAMELASLGTTPRVQFPRDPTLWEEHLAGLRAQLASVTGR